MADMPHAPDAAAHATFRVLPASARFILRGDDGVAEAAGIAFGVDIPRTACRSGTAANRAALWLGPDEWLLLASAEDAAAVQSDLEAGLADLPHALVGVSHREQVLEITGPRAADVLNAGCPLDLDDTAFPVAMCTRTILAKAPIVLWRTGTNDFQLHVWRSFLPYARAFLIEARTRL